MTTRDGENTVQGATPEPQQAAEVVQNQPAQPAPPPTEQPLTRAELAQLIKAELAPLLESSKREIQSTKDRSRAEIERMSREARAGAAALQKIRQRVVANNPELENEIKLAEYEGKEEAGRYVETESQARDQWAQAVNDFNTNMTQFVTDMGLDPKNKEIDWAEDEQHPNGVPNLQGRQKRILASVGKIQKAEREAEKQNRATREKQIAADIEARIRKSLNIEGVNVEMNGPSTGDDGIPTSMEAFRSWVADLSLAEHARLAPKIDKMLNEGKIK